jgi:hypothetical protein
MPTTLTGLLLFVVLLLPGFAYLVGRERHGVERRVSALRETVSIAAASITAELIVLAATAVIWANTVDVADALKQPGDHAATLIPWGVGLLIAASASPTCGPGRGHAGHLIGSSGAGSPAGGLGFQR